jgi:hypothetical protein
MIERNKARTSVAHVRSVVTESQGTHSSCSAERLPVMNASLPSVV